MQDGSLIDASIQYDPQVDQRRLTVYTEDNFKVGVYDLRIKLSLEDYPSNPGSFKDFTIEILPDENCLAANIQIVASDPVVDQTYTVARTPITASFNAFTVTPAYCDINYAVAVTPTIGEPIFVFDESLL